MNPLRLSLLTAAIAFAQPALAQNIEALPAQDQAAAVPSFTLPTDPEQGQRDQRVRRDAKRTAYAALALSAIDGIETCIAVSSGRGSEGNPLYGKHPSCAKVAGIKIITGALFLLTFNRALDRDPYAARRGARIFLVVQGGMVLANARFAF